MTFRHLEIFIAVADTGSMTGASKKLYISQPTVSQAIRELETHYGFLLFERYGRKLSITQQGNAILSYARHIQSLLGDMEQTSKRLESSGVLRIGASMTIGSQLLPAMVETLKAGHPEAEVQVVVRNTRDLEELLLNNQLDLVLLEGVVHYPELLELPFAEDPIALVCGPTHPLYKGSLHQLSQLQGMDFLVRESGSGTRELFEGVLASQSISWRIGWECSGSDSLIQAAKRGFGIGVLSRSLVEKDLEEESLTEISFPEAPLKRIFSLVHHQNKYFTPLMKSFFRQVLEETGNPSLIEMNATRRATNGKSEKKIKRRDPSTTK